MELLANKVALITGASRGIGKAIAEAFVEHGACVLIGDITPEIFVVGDALYQTANGRARAVRLDVTSAEQAQAAVDAAVREFGCLDVLVNNAGIHRPHPFLEFPLAEMELVFRVNFYGSFLCGQAAARQMVKQGNGGCIINMSSASGKKPDEGGSAYNSSKSAIISLTRIEALELGKYQIRANAILPGATDTEMLRNVFTQVPGLKQLLEERTPLGKMAAPRDQANAAVFLASYLASNITGEQLVVSGGEFMET